MIAASLPLKQGRTRAGVRVGEPYVGNTDLRGKLMQSASYNICTSFTLWSSSAMLRSSMMSRVSEAYVQAR
jgi:hypothetical protein